jgi:Zn-dependent M28 family amino/carboxypeptidase
MAGVAVGLEVVRALVAGPPLPSAVLLLMNGAEETILQAAHGFATQHPWFVIVLCPSCMHALVNWDTRMAAVKVFVNIEACGAGGREIVFQTGPGHPWVARSYAASVPRPHISVLAQEIFQADVIPSDTDYRIYRDYARVPGIDMAWYENGYVYVSVCVCMCFGMPSDGCIVCFSVPAAHDP